MKKWLIRLGIVMSFLIFLSGIYGYRLYRQVEVAFEEMFETFLTRDLRVMPLCIESKDPFSILLLGIDANEERTLAGRADTMMVVTLNPAEGTTKILSLARDTRVEIVGRGFDDKINHAYAFGGTQMTINTVQRFLNIPIDYFIEIDMDGFAALVNAIGTITLENNLEFSEGGFHFPIGTLQMNGAEVLSFARMRYEDPRGEFGRQERQRNIIEALANELMRFSPRRYRQVLNAIVKYAATNLTFNEAKTMLWNYRGALVDITKLDLRGEDEIIEGIYYQVISEEDRLEMVQRLRQHLKIEE